MNDFNDVKWKSFTFQELGFQIYNSKAYHTKDIDISNGRGLPYLTRTKFKNGYSCNVSDQELEKNPKNTISFGAENAKFFYHPYEYITGNKMYYIVSNNFNRYSGLFVKQALQTAVESCFSYGNGMIPKRVLGKKIFLPVDSDGNPDFKFMENYIKEIETQKKNIYKAYALEKMASISEKKIESLDEKKWKDFYVENIFNIRPGKRLIKANMKQGEIPFIGATDSNNGITNFVSNINVSKDKNVLGVNYNGSVCHSFYHPYECIFSDDVKRFELKNITGNEYIYLFLSTTIAQQRVKFSYGYKFKEARMRKQKIMLPINEKEEPDYEYMEQYIKNIVLKKYMKYLSDI